MSLVGPRPSPTYEVDAYDEWHYRRLEASPGLTGLWQVSGRCELSFEEMVQLDLDYVSQQSPSLDLKILVQTIPAVLAGRGAG
jgi:lipopolysaccharide/colanic/teichoic acid biosynthesis glycosyltransferase